MEIELDSVVLVPRLEDVRGYGEVLGIKSIRVVEGTL
jgi:hypothetical protein